MTVINVFQRALSGCKPDIRHINRCCFHSSSFQTATFTSSDAVMPPPLKTKLTSCVGATIAISLGITAGAMISKNIASFLEENDLFVPSDDDDDD